MQSDPVNGTVAYLGDTELLVPAGSTVVSGQRTYTVLGHAVAVRTATTGVTGSVMTWLDTDPQGTAEITENPTTGATTTRLFDAFGNPRGTPVTWASNDGFLNQPTDSLTGLDDLGARVYQPTLGRFLSEDSVFDASDPQQDNGYSYARNNPASSSDPSGLHAVDDNGETDPYWTAVQRQNVQHAATPNPVFQPNALSKAGGGLAIINARINKLMRLSNTLDAAVTAIASDPNYNQQLDAVTNPPPPTGKTTKPGQMTILAKPLPTKLLVCPSPGEVFQRGSQLCWTTETGSNVKCFGGDTYLNNPFGRVLKQWGSSIGKFAVGCWTGGRLGYLAGAGIPVLGESGAGEIFGGAVGCLSWGGAASQGVPTGH